MTNPQSPGNFARQPTLQQARFLQYLRLYLEQGELDLSGYLQEVKPRSFSDQTQGAESKSTLSESDQNSRVEELFEQNRAFFYNLSRKDADILTPKLFEWIIQTEKLYGRDKTRELL